MNRTALILTVLLFFYSVPAFSISLKEIFDLIINYPLEDLFRNLFAILVLGAIVVMAVWLWNFIFGEDGLVKKFFDTKIGTYAVYLCIGFFYCLCHLG